MIIDSESIPKCTYMYGLQTEQMDAVKHMRYDKALLYKINCAEELNIRLHNDDIEERDFARINAVSRAIVHNESLLAE